MSDYIGFSDPRYADATAQEHVPGQEHSAADEVTWHASPADPNTDATPDHVAQDHDIYDALAEETSEVLIDAQEGADNDSTQEQPGSTPSSDVWFVPDPDSQPPEEDVPLHTNAPRFPPPRPPVESPKEEIASTSPSSSAWGSTVTDIDTASQISTQSTSPSSTHTPTTSVPRILPKLGGPGGWNMTIPTELASPRQYSSPDPSSPRVSAHRSGSVSSPRAPPQFASPRPYPTGPTAQTTSVQPRVSSPQPSKQAIPIIPAGGIFRDSVESQNDVISSSPSNSSHLADSDGEEDGEDSASNKVYRDSASNKSLTGSTPISIQSRSQSSSSVSSVDATSSLRSSGGVMSPSSSSGSVPKLAPRKSVNFNPMKSAVVSSSPAVSASPSTSSSSPHIRSSVSSLAFQPLPAPIAEALHIQQTPTLVMKEGGDVHLSHWAWDAKKHHPFLKVSADASLMSWSSGTHYGLARSSTPLLHKKTFVEIAKAKGVSQHLHLGLAKTTVDFSCSPAKLQFNQVNISGEWCAVWIKSSSTGDRLGALIDLDAHKLTVYRNGVEAYHCEIPSTFQVTEDPNTAPSTAATSSTELTEPPTPAMPSDATAIYPFIGVCGDQELIVTELPEFEKYLDIVWAHSRRNQLKPKEAEALDVPGILQSLGLQQLRPKFEGMSLADFQKLKDVDLRKIGANPDQRKRLLSHLEAK